jgi:hypothetical protein
LLKELPGGGLLSPIARRLEWLLVPAYDRVAAHRGAFSRLIPSRSKARANALILERRS